MARTSARWEGLTSAWLTGLMVLLVSLMLAPSPAHADEQALTRSRVEAAYLFKFTDFVTWPAQSFAGPSSPIVIVVMGDEGLARELALTAAGKKVQGRDLQVLQASDEDAVPEAHVLFIGPESAAAAAGVLAHVRDRPVLTVSNRRNVHRHGTMVNFVMVDERVRFDVSLARAQQAGLRISALMLTAARTVTGSV